MLAILSPIENITFIIFANTSSTLEQDVGFFKGDNDQDRPNFIRKAEENSLNKKIEPTKTI